MARVKCPHCFHVNPDQQENCQQCGAGLPRIRIEARSAISEAQPKGELNFRRGQVVAGRYTVLNLIGQGGMGCIYKVHDNTLGEDVALKTLLPQFLQDKIVLERFYNEAKIARRLAHPNIVRVHDIGEDGKILYISMEYLQGMSLREILDNLQPGERLPIAQTLRIFDELCAALEYAHQFTVHRDIKPENVMLGQDGAVRLMDFGISKLMANTRLTNASIVMGTPFYMSPEQIRNSRDVDARADLYSVGVMLYEILTGTVPTGVPKPASQVTQDVPPALDKIVAKCVEPDPRERYQSATELREAFQPVRRHIKSGISNSKTSLIRHSSGSYSMRKIAGAVFLLAIAALAVWGFTGAEARRKAILAAPVEPVAVVAPVQSAGPTMDQYEALLDDLRSLSQSMALPGAGLNEALRQGESFWKDAQQKADAFDTAEALRLARNALQCYLAPLIHPDGMVFVPPGPVTVTPGGAPVEVPGFFIDAHEVTVGQYTRFLEAEPTWTLPAEFENPAVDMTQWPITNVTCIDAMAYAAWNGTELPAEAQWARAAYGDVLSDFPWDGPAEPEYCNVWFSENPNYPSPFPVDSFEKDVSRYGCFDLVGNASEWTFTTEPPLGQGEQPVFQSMMVVRGGNFGEVPQPWTGRRPMPYEQKALWLGFRCVLNVPSDPAAARAIMDTAR